ncbi:hypothetical protein AAHA92_31525 [Salvia divinorum]|uniref:Uncharacterized protein n=1 Tax=Salvia divinorum TaxID=28513 RepID=A0ABD1FQJ6_SALDI
MTELGATPIGSRKWWILQKLLRIAVFSTRFWWSHLTLGQRMGFLKDWKVMYEVHIRLRQSEVVRGKKALEIFHRRGSNFLFLR